MGCTSARGTTCLVTGDRCMFLIPNSKACAEKYGEGPDANQNRCEDCKFFYLNDGKRCCTSKPFYHEPRTEFLEDDLVCCGGFEKKDSYCSAEEV